MKKLMGDAQRRAALQHIIRKTNISLNIRIQMLSYKLFFTCNICSSESKENITKIATRLKEHGVGIIHLGACAVKCKADNLEEKKVFISIEIKVVEGTH